MLVVQDDLLTASRLATVMVVPLTTNLDRAKALGNVLLSSSETGFAKPSVALYIFRIIGRIQPANLTVHLGFGKFLGVRLGSRRGLTVDAATICESDRGRLKWFILLFSRQICFTWRR